MLREMPQQSLSTGKIFRCVCSDREARSRGGEAVARIELRQLLALLLRMLGSFGMRNTKHPSVEPYSGASAILLYSDNELNRANI